MNRTEMLTKNSPQIRWATEKDIGINEEAIANVEWRQKMNT